MHRIGDIVRLNRGWTPMCVIGISRDGDVIARYCKYSYSITEYCYKKPQHCYNKKREQDEFTKWDGNPLNFKVLKPMSLRYKTIFTNGTDNFSGVKRGETASGLFIIESDSGPGEMVYPVHPDFLVEDIPYTFSVKSTANSHRCHYTLPHGANVNLGDFLGSKSGNTYVVTALDTKNRNPKGQFKGHRLVKEEL